MKRWRRKNGGKPVEKRVKKVRRHRNPCFGRKLTPEQLERIEKTENGFYELVGRSVVGLLMRWLENHSKT